MLSTSLSLWPKASVRVVLVAQRREYDVEHCGTYDLGILLKGWLWSTSLRGLLPSPKEIIEEGAYSDVFCSPALSNVYSFAVLPPKAHHSQWCPAKRKTKSTAWNSWNSVCGWVRSTWSKTKVRSEMETQKNPSSERMSTEAHNLFTVNIESLDLWKMSCGSSCGSVWFLFALSTNIQQDSMHSRRASGSCYALPKALAIEGSRWHWSLSNIGLTPQSKCPPAELQHQGNELLQVRKPRKEKLHSLTLRQPQQLGSKWEERNKGGMKDCGTSSVWAHPWHKGGSCDRHAHSCNCQKTFMAARPSWDFECRGAVVSVLLEFYIVLRFSVLRVLVLLNHVFLTSAGSVHSSPKNASQRNKIKRIFLYVQYVSPNTGTWHHLCTLHTACTHLSTAPCTICQLWMATLRHAKGPATCSCSPRRVFQHLLKRLCTMMLKYFAHLRNKAQAVLKCA